MSLSVAVAAAFASGEEARAPAARATRSRRRLWELPPRHHCALLGAAFDAAELRHMFRRGGYSEWEAASDYALHSSAVCFARQRNNFSVLAQRALEERSSAAVHRLSAAGTSAEVLEAWRASAAQGEAVAAYWAALTHSCCDLELDELLSQEMHMAAHAQFAWRRATLRRLRTLEERNAELATRLSNAQNTACELRRENTELAAAPREIRADLQAARTELERWRSGGTVLALQARLAEAHEALEASHAAMRRMEKTVQPVSPAPAPAAPRSVPAPAPVAEEPMPDLAGRRVLCVGGKTSLVPQYRALVEGAGGEFAHHDGGIEHRVARLPSMLGAADLVVCLAGDCSHAAYRLAKRYCKAKGKRCALLGNSSATALARCISREEVNGTKA
ncbi:MAG: DUF2325 domain-containing protein [Betaproteobacteria bacterium]